MKRGAQPGEMNHRWKGGRYIRDGYVFIKHPTHPRADRHGYILEHILIAERVLGRHLPEGVQVHHVNEDGTDNKGSNLVVCENQAYHKLLHLRARSLRATGSVDERKCAFCKQFDEVKNMARATKGTFFHARCRNIDNQRRRGKLLCVAN